MTNSTAIETDYVGSTYVCGSGESDHTTIFDFENSQTFIMKTNHLGVLQWNYLFYPIGKNYTFCSSIAWAGDSSSPPLLGVAVTPKPLVFVGHTYLNYITIFPFTTLSKKCFIS